jgi:hypothetical protein
MLLQQQAPEYPIRSRWNKAIRAPQLVSASLPCGCSSRANVFTRRGRLGYHLDTHCASREIEAKAWRESVNWDEAKRACRDRERRRFGDKKAG